MKERFPEGLRAAMDDLGQDRLVDLHERGAGGEQGLDLLAEHPDDVVGQRLARLVGPIADALQPHGTRQQIGPGRATLTGRSVSDAPLPARGRPGDAADRGSAGRRPRGAARFGRDVQGLQFAGELVGIST